MRTRHISSLIAALLIAAVSLQAGLLPSGQPYIESGAYVAGEAEYYHASVAADGDEWVNVPADAPGAFVHARGQGYMHCQPADGDVFAWGAGPYMDYTISITSTGIYILWLRWDSPDNASDSVFAGIVELADGPGGNVDWYQVHDNMDGDFDTDPWDALGGFEANESAPARIPMSFNIPAPGTYTLRIAPREDGSTIDSWILQSFLVTDPTNTQPIITVPDTSAASHGGSVVVPVLANDSGAINTTVIELVTAPAFGIATPQPDGTILYEHTTGAPGQDTFTYRVGALGGGTSAPASVAITLTPPPGTGNGNLPYSQPYREANGYVAGEAEFYHDAFAALDDTWTFIDADSPGAIANARGPGYMQALPDGDPATKDYDTGAALEYKILISTPGIYNLWLRWDGVNDSSDSIFAGIPELGDGPGGNVDWYEAYDNLDADFNTDPWDIWGGFEADTFAPNPLIPMSWNIPTAGVYTLRVAVREDGAALDSWILQMPSPIVTDPTNTNPIIAVPDGITMHHNTKAGIPVLRNDSGDLIPGSVQIVSPPAYGTAVPQPDGRILYTHATGAPATDFFQYRVGGVGGSLSAPASVKITFSSDLRIPNTTVSMPAAPPPTSYSVQDAFPGISFTTPVSMESPPGDTNRLYVVQRNGQVYVITGIGGPNPQKSLFMDISSRVDEFGFNELGAKGITFHPGFASNGWFYLTYCHWDGGNRRVRLSRFSLNGGNPEQGDPNSELILINQVNDLDVHNINDILFGPDGYLYLGIGDEGFTGPGPDGMNNSQRIDKDIWSAILRIDVDKRPGNLEPNPHPGIPLDSGVARFSIPADNPFIGATQFNGIAVNPANVRTEFFVVGLRNPWQFSFDALNGNLWVSDVGNDAREEVTIMPPGGNGGWVFFEGNIPGPRPDRVPPPGFEYVRPVWTYGSETVGGRRSITGGFVYRGSTYGELHGTYICGDYVSGDIWTVEPAAGATNVTRITGEGGIVQFGLNPANGDILMLDLNNGSIRRLVADTPTLEFPQTLSETGFFADLADLSPNPGVIAYEPNLAFWSDHAIKRRWFVITNTQDQVTYSREGNWSFPAGMMWVKHFDLERDRGNPATKERIETRILVRTTNGAYGVSYQWNTNGTEAFLAPDAGVNFSLSITNQEVPLVQQWRIPSRAECLVCHTPAGGHALSFNTRQLNCPGSIAGTSNNLLRLLDDAGYVANGVEEPATLPRHIRPDEIEYSAEARARSYLAVNCGYCHMGAQSIVPGSWDGRAFVKLDDTGMMFGEASSNGGNTNNLYLIPDDTAHSIIWNRVAESNGFTRMPPLATFEKDQASAALLADWINGELASWQNYAMWRQERFGNTTSPEGEPDFDADDDLRTNYEEFLTRTDPNDDTDLWMGEIIYREGVGLEVAHDLYNRAVTIEVSTKLEGGQWARWNMAANNGAPIASGMVMRITVPATNVTEFFRFRVEEL